MNHCFKSISRNLFSWPIFSSVKLQIHRKCSVFKMSDSAVQEYLKKLLLEHDNLNTNAQRTPEESKRLFEIKPIIQLFERRNNLHENIEALSRKQSDDKDAMEIIKQESLSYLQRMMDVDRDLQSLLLEPKLTEGGVLLEVTAGAGLEAQIFASELFQMYESYATYKDWEVCVVSLEKSDIDGIRKGSMFINGVGAPELMKIETGVHRVQRIPATEKDGRIHTSTVSVDVHSKPTDTDANIPDRDLVVETEQNCVVSDQHVNTTGDVRDTHALPSTEVECREDISEENNEDIVVQKPRTASWRNKNEERISKPEPKIGLSSIKELVRTYDHCKDMVTEHRRGGGIAHNVQEFLEGDHLLEQIQNNLLRINWRKDFLEEINQFAVNMNSKTADAN